MVSSWTQPHLKITIKKNGSYPTLYVWQPLNMCHVQHFPYTTAVISSTLAHWKGSAAVYHQCPSPASGIPSGPLVTEGILLSGTRGIVGTKPMPQLYPQCAIMPSQNVVTKCFPIKKCQLSGLGTLLWSGWSWQNSSRSWQTGWSLGCDHAT